MRMMSVMLPFCPPLRAPNSHKVSQKCLRCVNVAIIVPHILYTLHSPPFSTERPRSVFSFCPPLFFLDSVPANGEYTLCLTKIEPATPGSLLKGSPESPSGRLRNHCHKSVCAVAILVPDILYTLQGSPQHTPLDPEQDPRNKRDGKFRTWILSRIHATWGMTDSKFGS